MLTSSAGNLNSEKWRPIQAELGTEQKWGCNTIKMQCEENCINVNIILAATFYYSKQIKNFLFWPQIPIWIWSDLGNTSKEEKIWNFRVESSYTIVGKDQTGSQANGGLVLEVWAPFGGALRPQS